MADLDRYFYEAIANSDPEKLRAMVEGGLAPQRSAIAKQRLGIGQGFMGTPTPQGQAVGRTYVASSPLEHLATAMSRVVGAKLSGDAMQREEDLTGTTGTGRMAAYDMIRKLAQGGQAPPPGPDPYFTPMDYSKT